MQYVITGTRPLITRIYVKSTVIRPVLYNLRMATVGHNGWQRACPKCLNDDIEKVGWGYWFCGVCGDIWEMITKGGKAARNPGKSENSLQTPGIIPNPGSLEKSDEIDYPI